MEDIGFGIGVLLAILGPLLLVLVIWILSRLLRSFPPLSNVQPKPRRKLLSVAAATGVTFVALVATYLPGRLEYDELCRLHGRPVVETRISVPGFFRTKMFPYEAHPYLSQGFEFVEAPNPYDESSYYRYTLADDNTLAKEEIDAPTSQFAVDKQTDTHSGGAISTKKLIYELKTGRRLAEAHDIVYEGGPLSIFMGVYAMSSCPDPSTQEGSTRFRAFYNLEKDVLRGGRNEIQAPAE